MTPEHPSRRALLLGAPLALAALAFAPQVAVAAKPEFWRNDAGLAIRGYDPVAYFKSGKPVKGLTAHTLAWRGATWRFASAENKAAFEAAPTKYAPQFGGYCAWAVSRGYTASVDPRAWEIVGGKLYLNYSLGVRRTWRKNRAANIARGERNWPRVLGR